MRRALPFVLFIAVTSTPAAAITGQAPPAGGAVARAIVIVEDSDGDLCTGTAIARDVVLTAAHCVAAKRAYRVRTYQTPRTIAVRSVSLHPGFSAANYARSRATADVAVVKLSTVLPDSIEPAPLAPARRVSAGETLTIAGFGVTEARTPRGLGIPRQTNLEVTGQPGSLQIRLVDPLTRDRVSGRGGCTGDSGGPAFSNGEIIGVIGWSTAANGNEGCGGLTGIVPLVNYRGWVIDAARKYDVDLN